MRRQSRAEKCEADDERNALYFLNDQFHEPARGQILQTYGEASTKIGQTRLWPPQRTTNGGLRPDFDFKITCGDFSGFGEYFTANGL
jgi:hypothetical protein